MVRREKREGLTLSLSLELEAFIDVLADSRAVTGFEQVHVADSALGGLACARRVILREYSFEVDVPAVVGAFSHDELGSYGSGSLASPTFGCTRHSLKRASALLSFARKVDCGGNGCCDVLG